MPRNVILLVAIAASLLGAGSAEAADVSGTWRVTGKVAAFAFTLNCDFKPDGPRLGGVCVDASTNDAKITPGKSHPLTAGAVSGDQVEWTYQSSFLLHTFDVTFKGQQTGSQMAGSIRAQGHDGTFTATKVVRPRDTLIYAAVGLSVWLNGAVTFRLGGRVLFEHGPLTTAAVAVVIAVLVCLAFRFTMTWRKGRPSQAVTIAVVMALPGLFGEAARQLVFPWATGLRVDDDPTFAAVIFFGNGVLLTYALIRQEMAQDRGL